MLMTWVTFVTFITFVTFAAFVTFATLAAFLKLMSSVLAGPSLLTFLAALITEWGSQGAIVKWTRDLYPRRTQQK